MFLILIFIIHFFDHGWNLKSVVEGISRHSSTTNDFGRAICGQGRTLVIILLLFAIISQASGKWFQNYYCGIGLVSKIASFLATVVCEQETRKFAGFSNSFKTLIFSESLLWSSRCNVNGQKGMGYPWGNKTA